jgi:outer membrane translocation and assembly module TamA
VIPRLQGETVLLEIRQQDDRPDRSGRSFSTQRTATMVRGRLGEWLELGDISNSGNSRRSGLGAAGSVQGYSGQQIRVKVDCLDCTNASSGQ